MGLIDHAKGKFIAFAEGISNDVSSEINIDYVNENNRFSLSVRPVLSGKPKCPACYADESFLDLRDRTKKAGRCYFHCKKCNLAFHFPIEIFEKFKYFITKKREKKIEHSWDLEEVYSNLQRCHMCAEKLTVKECKNGKTVALYCQVCESRMFLKKNLVKEYLHGER